MSATDAPSRNTCLTLEFINTVQRVPRSQGACDVHASWAKSVTLYPILLANVWMNVPHPELQASLSSMRTTVPFSTKIAFMSCPPISRIKLTSGINDAAARSCAIVSMMPLLSPNAALMSSSPYPVEHEPTTSSSAPLRAASSFKAISPSATALIGFPRFSL